MPTELKPCTHCGGEGSLHKDYRFPRRSWLRKVISIFIGEPEIYAYFIACRSCAAQGGWSKTRSGAIQNWNMRQEKTG